MLPSLLQESQDIFGDVDELYKKLNIYFVTFPSYLQEARDIFGDVDEHLQESHDIFGDITFKFTIILGYIW